MVGQWSPDPPPEPENITATNSGYLMIIAASDEEETDEGYEGYEPLYDIDALPDTSDSEEDVESQAGDTPSLDTEACHREKSGELRHSVPNAGDVWRGCRSGSSSQISEEHGVTTESSEHSLNVEPEFSEAGPSSSRLELGEQQVAQVMAAMANVTLPPSAVPQWAAIVPEEQWMQHMLDRIRCLQEKKNNSN